MNSSDASNLGEDEVRHRLKTHLIKYEDLKSSNYDTFIENRSRILADKIEKLCKGIEWD